MVPDQPKAKAKVVASVAPKPVAVQANGLPVGVEILANGPAAQIADNATAIDDVILANEPAKLIRNHTRLTATEAASTAKTIARAASKKRKPGRPKAGKLDVPRSVEHSVMPASLPAAPRITTAKAAAPVEASVAATSSAPTVARRMSDISSRKTAAPTESDRPTKAEDSPAAERPAPKTSKTIADITSKPTHPKDKVHHIGVPAIHFGPVFAFMLRARLRPQLVAVAVLGSLSLSVICGYLAWIALTQGLTNVIQSLVQAGPKLGYEVLLLGLLYYIGRNISQAALTFGIAREADQRPVSLSRQFGVAINTFTRHLTLDATFGLGSITLLAAGVGLFLTGGADWPIDKNLQMGVIFVAYLGLLYGLTAIAISRGLARVNLTLSTHRPTTAAKVGWRLFSHRLELIGPRCGALALEALLALPLIGLGIAAVASAPASLHPLTVIGAALLATIAGALIGVGTAAWWTMLYRQLVLTDHADNVIAFLSSRQPEDARRGPLSVLVAVVSIITVIAVALPWVEIAN